MTSSFQLNVWYEGAKIEVGKYYNPSDLAICLTHPNKNTKIISYEECIIDSYKITQEGLNWYNLTYRTNDEEFIQEFFVEGIVYDKYIDLEFKVLYVKNGVEEDLTEDFGSELISYGHLYVDWNRFLKKVNDLKKYGLYIVTVPKLTGLSNQYDMDWEVICTDSKTLKASMKKIYNEEEKDNGEENENN